MIKFDKKKIYCLLLFLAIIAGLFFLSPETKAQETCDPQLYGADCENQSYSGIVKETGGSGWSCPWSIEGCLSWVRTIMGSLIGWVGDLIDDALRIEVANVAVVQEGWNISRNFANMFFIVALIIMAFATIFSISNYDFRKLIVNFLIAALLVNFSLVIGEIIIDWSQSLSNVFLQAMNGVGDRIGQGADFGQQFEDKLKLSVTTGGIAVFANIILLSITLFSMVVLLFFSIVRIPILWALLIVAPIAWILYILPTTQKYNKMWWDYFISWNLFMPIYLFFIYFGVMFLSKQDQVIANNAPSIIPGLGQAGSLQTVFFYILIALFLIWGAKAAMGFSRAGGAGALAGWAYGKGAVMRRAAWRSTGVPGAWQAKRKQQREEGIKIPFTNTRVFGEQQQKERDAWMASHIPGLKSRGMDTQIQREFVNKTSKVYDDLKQKLDLGQIKLGDVQKKAGEGSASNPETYAYRKILAERGQLEEGLYAETFQQLAKNPYAAQDFAKMAKENMKPEEMLKMIGGEGDYGPGGKFDMMAPNFSPAKRELIKKIMSDPNVINQMSNPQYAKAIDLFGGRTTKEGKDFIKAITETRPDIAIEHQMSDADWSLATREKDEYKDILAKPWSESRQNQEIKMRMYENSMKGPKETADRHLDVWNRPEFKRALLAKIQRLHLVNPGNARRFVLDMNRDIAFSKNAKEKTLIFQGIVGGLGLSTPSPSSSSSPSGGSGPTTPPPSSPPPVSSPPSSPGGSSGASPFGGSRASTSTWPPQPQRTNPTTSTQSATPPAPTRVGGPTIIGAPPKAETKPRFESMNFQEIERDPEYSPFLQQKALEDLKTNQKEYFDREFTGELDDRGYLIRKDGKGASARPSQNFSGGLAMERVLSKTKEELRRREVK